jgi:hypothetical protein
MAKYDLPPVSFSDGLGWGTTFLWVCADDDCPVFRQGFHQTLDRYGLTSSMRVIVEPDTGRESVTVAATFDPEHLKTFADSRKKSMDDLAEKRDAAEAADGMPPIADE